MADFRTTDNKRGNLIGIAMAVGVHLLVLVFGSFTGLTYIYPPPEEKTIIIDFTTEEQAAPSPTPAVAPKKVQAQKKTPVPKPQNKVEAPSKVETTPAGEVEVPSKKAEVKVPEPPVKEETVEEDEPIDMRALFKSAGSSTSPADTARVEKTDMETRMTTEAPGRNSWSLDGRKLDGQLPSPAYTVQESGTIVVNIWVDMYGNVEKAVVAGEGTTVTNRQLWNAAREAAFSTKFKKSIDHPELQQGTITYVFKLK